MKQQRTICLKFKPLCFVPCDLGNILRYQRLESNSDVVDLPRFGNQVPCIAEIFLEAELSGDHIVLSRGANFVNPPDIECTHLTVQRTSSDHVPTSSAEQKLIRAKSGANGFPFRKAVIFYGNYFSICNRFDQGLIDRVFFFQWIALVETNLDGARMVFKFFSQWGRKSTLEFQCRLMCRMVEGKALAVGCFAR